MSIVDLNRILVIALYLPVCLLVYKRLYPRLSPISKVLASSMLAAQLLVFTVSLSLQNRHNAFAWLWHLDLEHNVPATLASTQLALIGAVALLTAWLSKARRPWLRLYYFGLGLLFIHLARDEFFLFHEDGLVWQLPFAQFGAAVALATALCAFGLPRNLRIWHLCILSGLATGGAGALVIDVIQWNGQCFATIFFTYRCEIYVLEETLEFLGMWLALLGILGLFSAAAPSLSRRWQLLYLAPALWIITHHVPYLIRLAEFNAISPASIVAFADEDMTLHMYRLEQNENRASAQFYAAARTWHHYTGVGYSLHLVDQIDGVSYAGVDVSGRRNASIPYRLFGKRYVYKQQMSLEFTPRPPSNRALWLVFTTWREQDAAFMRKDIKKSNFPLLGDNQIILSELVLEDSGGPPASSPIALFEPGVVLEGAEIPDGGQPGASLTLQFDWRSDLDLDTEYNQFLHFRHEESGNYWVYDQQPLGSRLPTRLWYKNLADSETWRIPLPSDLAPGPYMLYTGLYRASDFERLPASAADGAPYTDYRIPVGRLTIDASDW